jgi:hypothetical protein
MLPFFFISLKIMELLNQHVSIRKFKTKRFRFCFESIIYSGTKASTTGNMQLYSVVVSEKDDVKEKLIPLHFNQCSKKRPGFIDFCC